MKSKEGDARTKRPLRPHQVSLTVQTRRTRTGALNVSLTLANDSVAPRKGEKGDAKELQRDMHLFNCKLRAAPTAGELAAFAFDRTPEDFRYDNLRMVWAHGRNAAADGYLDGQPCAPTTQADEVRTTTWPLHIQRKLVTNPDLELAFSDLSNPATLISELVKVQTGMQTFLTEWDTELTKAEWQSNLHGCGRAGKRATTSNGRPNGLTWVCAPYSRTRICADRSLPPIACSSAGASRGRDIRTWRLFQLVFQIIQVSALALARSMTPPTSQSWTLPMSCFFPTGGGKTEAYLGLIAAALFYDRLRGKKPVSPRCSAFPAHAVRPGARSRRPHLYAAEDLRRTLISDGQTGFVGDPFRLGFFVGSSNTPNRLSNDISRDEESIDWWERELAEDPALASCGARLPSA